MSVPLSKRKTGELKVITDARRVTARVVTIASNEKHFPKRLRWCYTSRIVDACVKMFVEINEANSVFVKTAEDISKRIGHWKEAQVCCTACIALVDLSFDLRQVSLETTESLIADLVKVRQLIRSRITSDTRRFTHG